MKKLFWKSRTFVQALRQNGLSTLTAALRHWVHAILPLSSCSRSTRMFLRGIMCCALVVVLVSCRIHKYSSDAVRAVQDSSALFSVARSVDTIYRHDSVYVREVMRGDTVYLTRTEWRDRWRTRVVHDTVQHTKYVDRVVEKPPERYIPKFYKWCTGLFWAIIAGVILYYVLKIVIRFYIKK